MRVQPGKRWVNNCKAWQAGLAGRMGSRRVEDEEWKMKGQKRQETKTADVLPGQISHPSFYVSLF